MPARISSNRRCRISARASRAFLLVVGAALIAMPASAGSYGIEVGVIRIMPQSKSTILRTELNPTLLGSALGLDSFDSPGTSFSPSDATTIVATFVRTLGDHFLIKFEGGIPPRFKLNGSGTVVAPGPSGALFSVDLGNDANQPLATARQWSPITLLQFRPLSPASRIQPYLGVGVGYTFFTNVKLGSGTDADLNRQFGTPLAALALKPGPTSASAHASSSIAMAFNGGVSWLLDDHWALTGSVSYGLLSTNTRIDLKAADGTVLARSRSSLVLNPLITGLLLNYRF